MDTSTENKHLLSRNCNQWVIGFNSLSLIANPENVVSGVKLDFLYGGIEARVCSRQRGDAITAYEQNTTQVELEARKWGALFMSPTIVILATRRTKDRFFKQRDMRR
jgi:hypothetical protein